MCQVGRGPGLVIWSGTCDVALHALHRAGSDARQGLANMVPAAVQHVPCASQLESSRGHHVWSKYLSSVFVGSLVSP